MVKEFERPGFDEATIFTRRLFAHKLNTVLSKIPTEKNLDDL
jgi:hypothetical protein